MNKSPKDTLKLKFVTDDRSYPIELRLLMYFVCILECWGLFNLIMDIVFKAPESMIKMYLVFSVFLPIYWTLSYVFKAQMLFVNAYYIINLITLPIIWYYAGGTNAGANVLFLAELVFYVMCLNGRKQKIFAVLSILSSSIISAVSNIPGLLHPLIMNADQIKNVNRNLGLSTSLLIMFLLLKQKKEYARERDLAIESEKELEKSNRLQKNFLANMSHEIRTPLGIVLGFNDLIAESDSLEQIHEYSANISESGKTLHTVINDILDYSKIESGKLDIIDVDYSLKDLITEIKHDIGLKSDEKGLNFSIEADENIPIYLYGDNIRIKQCLLNILSNAVKYTSQGSVNLKVERLDCDREDTCSLKFEVSDTGRGISEETIPKLFTAFQRLEEGQNRGIEGTGLGLAITKSLVDEMNGRIEVSSVYGEGSVFTIYLDQIISKKSYEQREDENKKTDISGVSILVVDDTKMNLTLISKLLTKEGAILKLIDNGEDSLAECKQNKYDVILLDHMMPGMDGIEVFEKLRNEEGLNKDTPVIMLTANAMAGAGKEYMDMGFDGYVSKPVKVQDLLAEISNCVK